MYYQLTLFNKNIIHFFNTNKPVLSIQRQFNINNHNRQHISGFTGRKNDGSLISLTKKSNVQEPVFWDRVTACVALSSRLNCAFSSYLKERPQKNEIIQIKIIIIIIMIINLEQNNM